MRLILAITMCGLLAACEIVPPGDDAGAAAGKVPGAAFSTNVCFQCSLRSCSGMVSACNLDTVCAAWLKCVSACPTDKTGVSADADCLRPCGLPVSTQVLYGCIQDFSTGLLLGCEQACEPLRANDAGGT